MTPQRIIVETIPYNSQRYDTLGDWVWVESTGTLYIYTTDTGDWRANMAIALHEQTEALLCLHRGITQEELEAFDTGDGACLDDPGQSTSAPYHTEHMTACAVERILVNELFNGTTHMPYEELCYALPAWKGTYVPLEERVKELSAQPIYND